MDDDPESWLTAAGLTETGAATHVVTAAQHNRLVTAAAKALAALDDLEAAEAAPTPDPVTVHLATPLAELHSAAAHLAVTGDICPVCRQTNPDWAATLATTVDTAPVTATQRVAFARRLGALQSVLDTDFTPIVQVVTQDGCPAELRTAVGPVVESVRALRDRLGEDGRRATPEVRAAVRSAHDALTSVDWRRSVTELSVLTDRQRQLRRARRDAVEPFLGLWREVRAEAVAADSWKAAAGCVRTLQNELRAERTGSLRTLTDSSVRALLDDVGLHLTGSPCRARRPTFRSWTPTGSQCVSPCSAPDRHPAQSSSAEPVLPALMV